MNYKIIPDFDKEYRKGWKKYVNVRDFLVSKDIRDFYVDNEILYIKSGNDIFEVEMIRKTPRYKVRYNVGIVKDRENFIIKFKFYAHQKY